MNMFFLRDNKNQKGFTLIEMVFGMAIFLIVIGISIDIFISILQQQKNVLSEQELLSQTSYAVGYMSGALRTAVQDPDGACLGTAGNMYLLTHCNSDGTACNGVKFINQSDGSACEEFYLDTANPANPVLDVAKNGGAGENLISAAFKINALKFILDGNKTLQVASKQDALRPRITMLINIQGQGARSSQTNIIQTTVSPRVIGAQ